MNLFKFLPVVALAAMFMPACSSDDNEFNPTPDPEPTEGEQIKKTDKITADETWTAENVYVLDGKVVVSEGATLTIQAGTIVKGAEGQESLASALVVDQGAKLMAEGT